MSHPINNCDVIAWQSASVLAIGIIIISLMIFSQSKKLKSKYLSQTITLTATSYTLLLSSTILLLGSILHTTIFGLDESSHAILHYIPIIETMLIESHGLCVDLLMGLTLTLISTFFIGSFVISQLLLHSYTKKLEKLPQEKSRAVLIKQKFPWVTSKLIILDEKTPNAFSLTLLRIKFIQPKVEDRIFLTSGMLDLLNEHELEGVLAHEHAHVINQDTRYSHLIFTICKLLFFDPFLPLLQRFMTKTQEFKADIAAVTLTQKPRSLAKALYKVILFNSEKIPPLKKKQMIFPNLFSYDNKTLVERIKRLLNYAKTNNLEL